MQDAPDSPDRADSGKPRVSAKERLAMAKAKAAEAAAKRRRELESAM